MVLPLLVLLMGLLASALVGVQLDRVLRNQQQERFDNAVDQAHADILGRMDAYLAVLRSGAALVIAEEGRIDRPTFDRFAQGLNLPVRYPGIQGLGYSAVLPAVEGPRTEALLRQLGVPGVRVTPAGARPDVHAIVFLQPLDRRNAAALGFDMFSHLVRRDAMQRARDTGRAAMSGKVELVQEIYGPKQAGFLIYRPVYGGRPTPADLESRRQALTGFIYAAFRADDLLNGIFGGQTRPRLHIAVFDDAPGPANLLHKSFQGDPAALAKQASAFTQRTLEVAGRRWTVAYYARPHGDLNSGRGIVWLFVVGGLLATLLLTGASWRQVQAHRAAEAEIAARKAGEAQRELLLGELNHRVKNTLATVQSIASQTLREGKSLAETRGDFEARLLALSHTHNLLTHTHWQGADLRQIVELELAPFRGQGAGRLHVEGEAVLLEPATAVAVAMALHELATNAAKYGALSVPQGCVQVRWRTREEQSRQRLHLEWVESEGAPVAKPSRRGFGTRLITQGLKRQLAGDVDLAFEAEGVRCRIDIPLVDAPDASTGWS
ncbi:CHASE domain-containing protein [Phenylobacterium deserti]|nr:CHASE domain-containing protein [Phenylobacterium deserti]